jgi:hypothetical protein
MSDSTLQIQGRILTPSDLDGIRRLMACNPDWNRTRLSRELCGLWDWRDATGRIKDMACRTMLLKLERRGLVQLPAPRHGDVNHRRGRSFQPVLHDTSPIECDLRTLGPVSLAVADTGPSADLWRTLLHCHHYLGFSTRVGKSIAYLASDCRGRPVGALLFGAAAWKTAGRDGFIGWTAAQRARNLDLVVSNMRFLVPPWIRVPHLASHVLGLALRRIGADWQRKYGHPAALAETFVDTERFAGTCYRAANWMHVGSTTGRTRNDVRHSIRAPVKDVYVCPLRRDFRRLLTGEPQTE